MGSTIDDSKYHIPYDFFKQCLREEPINEIKPLYVTLIKYWEGEHGEEWRDEYSYQLETGTFIPLQFLICMLCKERGNIQQNMVLAKVRDKWTKQHQN